MKIQINTPCHENWDGMSPQNQGRHCQKCDKVVTDFTRMDDFGILKHLHQKSNVCGRFTNAQLSEELQLPNLENPWIQPFRKIAFGSLLLGKFAMVQAATPQIKDSTEIVAAHEVPDSIHYEFRIKGTITQPTENEKRAIELHFQLDSFSIAIPTDNLNYSFDVPWEVINKQLKVSVKTTDSLYQLAPINLVCDEDGNCILNFSFDSVWMLNYPIKLENSPINTLDWHLEYTMGASPIVWGTFSEEFITTGMMVSTPDIDTLPVAKQKAIYKKIILHEKRESSKWWWLLPGFVVFVIGAWQWKRNKV